ncbi:unnamed protein product [Penicillium manginii]
MTDASRACITLLAACNTCQWLIRFLEYIYRSSMDDHDRHMEILIGCALIEFAFFHYVYTWAKENILSIPFYPDELEEDEDAEETEPERGSESKHCECCFFNWVKCDPESVSERTLSRDLEDSLDSSSTWAAATHVTFLDLDGDTLVNDDVVERGMTEDLEDPEMENHLSFEGSYGIIL